MDKGSTGAAREPQPEWMNTGEAASYCRYAAATFEKLRTVGSGPKFSKRSGGRRVVYRRSDLDAWLSADTRNSTSEPSK